MVDDPSLDDWFCSQVLPLEPALLRYIRRNWRAPEDAFDLLHDVYALALGGARKGRPRQTQSYVFAIAKHHLIQQARRARIVSFELVADLESVQSNPDLFAAERHMTARDELHLAQAGLNSLPPRCQEVVYLRKVEGLTTRETAERLGVGIDAIEQQLTKGMRILTDFMLSQSKWVCDSDVARRRARRRQDL